MARVSLSRDERLPETGAKIENNRLRLLPGKNHLLKLDRKKCKIVATSSPVISQLASSYEKAMKRGATILVGRCFVPAFCFNRSCCCYYNTYLFLKCGWWLVCSHHGVAVRSKQGTRAPSSPTFEMYHTYRATFSIKIGFIYLPPNPPAPIDSIPFTDFFVRTEDDRCALPKE